MDKKKEIKVLKNFLITVFSIMILKFSQENFSKYT